MGKAETSHTSHTPIPCSIETVTTLCWWKILSDLSRILTHALPGKGGDLNHWTPGAVVCVCVCVTKSRTLTFLLSVYFCNQDKNTFHKSRPSRHKAFTITIQASIRGQYFYAITIKIKINFCAALRLTYHERMTMGMQCAVTTIPETIMHPTHLPANSHPNSQASYYSSHRRCQQPFVLVSLAK